eukprot:5594562-Pyramimonas_sp.AAC.1
MARWGELQSDLPLLKYADDINKIVLADLDSTLGEFLDKLKRVDVSLNSKLQPFGHGQNMSKQEFLFHFSAIAHSCKQYLHDHPQSLEGRMRDDARYLGPRI